MSTVTATTRTPETVRSGGALYPSKERIREHLRQNGIRKNSKDWNQYEYAKWILMRDYVEYLIYYDYFIQVITEYIGV